MWASLSLKLWNYLASEEGDELLLSLCDALSELEAEENWFWPLWILWCWYSFIFAWISVAVGHGDYTDVRFRSSFDIYFHFYDCAHNAGWGWGLMEILSILSERGRPEEICICKIEFKYMQEEYFFRLSGLDGECVLTVEQAFPGCYTSYACSRQGSLGLPVPPSPVMSV